MITKYIYNENDLLSLSGQTLEGNYVLVNDLDMRKFSNDFKPLKFSKGVFDGNYKIIRNLNLCNINSTNTGLFLINGANSTIMNLLMFDSSISSTGMNSGIIAAFNDGLITNCVVFNSSIVSHIAGGLVGQNFGIISNCFFLGVVKGLESEGLICGESERNSKIIKCVAMGLSDNNLDLIEQFISGPSTSRYIISDTILIVPGSKKIRYFN